VDFVFSAIEATKDEIKKFENDYASADIPVVSNNSAHRWTKDVPMIIPEINPHHIILLDIQKKNHGWKKGFVVVKPNCSLQSYLPAIAPLMKYQPTRMVITTMQAISGAGKTFATFPEILDNVIPFIGGEEEKSEKEPLKILGKLENGEIKNFDGIKIAAHCNRVPASDGHMATVSVEFKKKPTREQILEDWKNYKPVLSISSKEPPPSLSNLDFSNFWVVWQSLENNYYDKSKLDPAKMLNGAISGLVQSVGDPYTLYLPPVSNNNFKQGLAGQFQGIGAELGMRDNKIIVIIVAIDTITEGYINADLTLRCSLSDFSIYVDMRSNT